MKKSRIKGWSKYMKGITNAEIRQKLEHIESELASLKNSKQDSYIPIIFFIIATLTAFIASIMMIIDPHPLIMFFLFLGLSQMIILVIYQSMNRKN